MPLAMAPSLDFLQEPPLPVPTPYYFSLSPGVSLPMVLKRPHRFFIETGPRRLLDDVLAHMRAELPDFALNLSNGSAYGGTLAACAAMAMEERFWLPPSRRMPIVTCLHEAVSNAVIHGNLGVGNPADTPEGFDEYYAHIATLANREPYCSRRIGIHGWYNERYFKISVSDKGSGFTDASVLDRIPDIRSRHGRGLFLIHSMADRVWIERDNRTLSMIFNH